jgi:hypothetical protein
MKLETTALLIFLAGCAHAPVRPIVAPAPPAKVEGEVAYRFLRDPNAPVPKLSAKVEFSEPAPSSVFPLPRYPDSALVARAEPAHVTLRVVIDRKGRIAEVKDSPLEASSTGPFAGEFRDAVLRALRHWRFTPGLLVQVEEGRDLDGDGEPDYREVVRKDTVPVFYDIRFDFEIVAGAGRVRSSATP